ncbi:MAG: hypothetical protein M3003_01175 [Candidatus Dormibacteraeota bacterium]|nr:hypothetical protein [Candidatus Dormibacteraeota bacterium]
MTKRGTPKTASKPIKLSDAAHRLGCHVETLRLRIRSGQLKATRGPHGAYYVSRKDLASLPRFGQRFPRGPAPRPTRDEVEASWDQMEQYLEKPRLGLARELKLFRQIRAEPASNRKLYHIIAVNRLGRAGMSFRAITGELGISTRHVRRLSERRPLDALRRDLQTIRSHRQALLEARRLVDTLRAGLEAEGFRYHRLPLPFTGRRRFWRGRWINPDEPQPAHKAKRLTQDERRALRRSVLTDEQIDAISMVGMGADEVHQLMLRGIGPRASSRT